MKKFILLLTSFFTFNSFAANDCGRYLVPIEKSEVASITDNFIAYLSILLDQNIIKIEQIKNLLIQFERNQIPQNPIIRADVHSAEYVHRDNLQNYLDSNQLELKKVLVWGQETINKHEKIKEKRTRANAETESAYIRLGFHLIQGGRFTRDIQFEKVEAEISSFELMTTPVTQAVWTGIMDSNPSHFIDDIDQPVENINWHDAKAFVEKLNRLSQSTDSSIQKLIQKFIFDHKRGDIYDLPTAAQWEFVMKDFPLRDGNLTVPQDDTELQEYAWIYSNSGQTTHPVATRKPRLINGHEFYDLEGNVQIWIKDCADKAIGGKDPVRENPEINLSGLYSKGLDWYSNNKRLPRGGAPSYDIKLSFYGLRLIRHVRTNEDKRL